MNIYRNLEVPYFSQRKNTTWWKRKSIIRLPEDFPVKVMLIYFKHHACMIFLNLIFRNLKDGLKRVIVFSTKT